jgi:hypothetical protein
MEIDKIKNRILKASEALNTNRIIYEINFWFGCSVSVKIGDIELNQNSEYGFFGWDKGIGEVDLIDLEKVGFLKKISERINEMDPLERTIEYEIVKSI